MMLFFSIFIGFGVFSAPCWAKDSIQQQEFQSLAQEKLTLESDLNEIGGDLEAKKNSVHSQKLSVEGLLQKTARQNKKIEEHLNTLMSWSAQQKTQKYNNAFDKDSAAKQYLAKAVIHSQYQSLKGDQKEMKVLSQQLAALSKETDALGQQLTERHGLLHKITQQQQRLQSQIEESQKHAAEAVVLKTASAQVSVTPVVVQEPLKAWSINSLAPPLDHLDMRNAKNLFGAFCVAAVQSETIGAIYEGIVIFSDSLKGLGNVIIVEHSDGYLSVYGNCDKLLKKIGDRVQPQEPIALVGHSGQLGEDCLYFEVRHNDRSVELPQWFPVAN